MVEFGAPSAAGVGLDRDAALPSVANLFEILRSLNRDGLTILLAEQNVTFGLKVVHTANLLVSGRVVYSGKVACLDRERVVRELGIGRLLRERQVDSQAAPTPQGAGG